MLCLLKPGKALKKSLRVTARVLGVRAAVVSPARRKRKDGSAPLECLSSYDMRPRRVCSRLSLRAGASGGFPGGRLHGALPPKAAALAAGAGQSRLRLRRPVKGSAQAPWELRPAFATFADVGGGTGILGFSRRYGVSVVIRPRRGLYRRGRGFDEPERRLCSPAVRRRRAETRIA